MEVMVVVLLIGIMTAMILPEMKGSYEDALLRSTSRELVNACHLAYSRSVSFNQSHRVRIDSANGRYIVERQVRDRSGENFVPLRDVPGGEGNLDTRITISFHAAGELTATDLESPTTNRESESPAPLLDPTITFNADGTADARDVLLRDRQGFQLLLRINPTTSRVKVVEVAGP
jgi:Tfp pilus assembly protein FimT